MSEFFAQPDDLGEPRASELQSGLGVSLLTQAGEAAFAGTRGLYRIGEYGRANAAARPDLDEFAARMYHGVGHPDAAPAELAIDDARKRVKDEGLEGELKLPEQPTIRAPVLDLMIAHAHERRDYNAAVSRGPQGFWPGALGFVTQIGAGVVDPVNIAAFSVPVMGEARMGALMARAGESILARSGVRAGIGAAQGAVGTAALQPADWWLHTQDGVDYTMADALKSIALGAGMGGVAHAGLGVFGDLRARVRGLPLEHSAEDQVIRALLDAQERPHAAAETEPTSTAAEPEATPRAPQRDLAGAPPEVAAHPDFDTRGSASDYDGIHPGEIFADLPLPVREDLVRTAAADVIGDRPGRAGEVLAIGAQQDPRIAESVHGSDLTLREAGSFGSDKWFEAVDRDANVRLTATFSLQGSRAKLEHIGTPESGALGQGTAEARNTVGPAAIRSLLRQFKALHPDVELITGDRVSGARHGGRYEADGRPTMVSVPVPPATKGPRARPERTFSLFEFLAQRGGLAPHPDVEAAFGGKNPFVPGFGRLIRKTGMSLDRAREAAVEAGYLHDAAQQHGGVTESTVNHLLDAIDAEARGARVYRAGEERARGVDRDEELHHINREIDAVLTENGHDVRAIPDSTRARVVEMMDRESVRDPLVAYERALLEEDRRGTEQGQHQADRPIAGFDVHEDAGRAPGEGGRAAGDQPEAGGPARAAGRDDGSPTGRPDPDAWRRLAEQRDPDAERDLAASKAAEAEPEPASVDPTKSVSAAEAAAAEADGLLKDIEPQLTEAERVAFRDALDQLAADKDARETLLRDGAACLIGAVA